MHDTHQLAVLGSGDDSRVWKYERLNVENLMPKRLIIIRSTCFRFHGYSVSSAAEVEFPIFIILSLVFGKHLV